MTLVDVVSGYQDRRQWLAVTLLRIWILAAAWLAVLQFNDWIWPAPCAGTSGWGTAVCGAAWGALLPMTALELVGLGAAVFLAVAAAHNLAVFVRSRG